MALPRSSNDISAGAQMIAEEKATEANVSQKALGESHKVRHVEEHGDQSDAAQDQVL